jgi:hypothetical protein
MGFLDMATEVTRQRLRRMRLDYSGAHNIQDNSDQGYDLFKDLHIIDYFCQRYPMLTVFW